MGLQQALLMPRCVFGISSNKRMCTPLKGTAAKSTASPFQRTVITWPRQPTITPSNFGICASFPTLNQSMPLLWQLLALTLEANTWDVVKTFEDAHASQVTDVKWGANAKFLASTSMDRSLKFFA